LRAIVFFDGPGGGAGNDHARRVAAFLKIPSKFKS